MLLNQLPSFLMIRLLPGKYTILFKSTMHCASHAKVLRSYKHVWIDAKSMNSIFFRWISETKL